MLLISAPNDIPFYATPNLGVFRISRHLKKSGLNCDVFDPNLDDAEQWVGSGRDYSVIGISGNNMCMQKCLELLHYFAAKQKRKAFLIVGGITPTYNYADWLACGLDAVVLGYGEEPLAALGQAGDRLQTERDAVLSGIPGLAYCGPNGRIKNNPAAPVTEELFTKLTYDNMLGIDIPYQPYWDMNARAVKQLSVGHHAFIVKTVRLFTSSQCPNRCGYCPSKFLSQAQASPARRFALKPEQSLELIVQASERYACDLVFFNDEEFLCDKKVTAELCHLIIEAKKTGSCRGN